MEWICLFIGIGIGILIGVVWMLIQYSQTRKLEKMVEESTKMYMESLIKSNTFWQKKAYKFMNKYFFEKSKSTL